jgi:hypothetical protein
MLAHLEEAVEALEAAAAAAAAEGQSRILVRHAIVDVARITDEPATGHSTAVAALLQRAVAAAPEGVRVTLPLGSQALVEGGRGALQPPPSLLCLLALKLVLNAVTTGAHVAKGTVMWVFLAWSMHLTLSDLRTQSYYSLPPATQLQSNGEHDADEREAIFARCRHRRRRFRDDPCNRTLVYPARYSRRRHERIRGRLAS